MWGIVIVGSGLETWRDGGRMSFERVSNEGGMFSALVTVSGSFWVLVSDREA